MSSKREEERNEKIIRGLMKLPPNRRCLNCNSLGPQYVCTDFWTFVCTTCSGIHREFTHRVKSVSMAKFTSQEVDAIQKGGNQRARELLLQAWDPQRRLPDNSNIEKVRQFIKNVYVDKKYSLEKLSDNSSRDVQGMRSPEDHTRRASSYHSYSQSPPYDFQYEERRYGKHAFGLTKKPGSDHSLYEGKLASFLSPTHFSGHLSDDSFPNDGTFTRASDYSVSGGSPCSETSRDISGDVPQLPKGPQDVDRSRHNGGRIFHPQRASSCGGFTSFDSNSMSSKSVNSHGPSESGSSHEQSAEFPQDRSSSTSSQNFSFLNTFVGPESNGTPFTPEDFSLVHFGGADVDFSKPPSAGPVAIAQHCPASTVATFTTHHPSPFQQPSSLNLFPTEPHQQLPASSTVETSGMINSGWATFDLHENLMTTRKEEPTVSGVPLSGGNIFESTNPFAFEQRSSYHDSVKHDHSVLVSFEHGVGHDVKTNDTTVFKNDSSASSLEASGPTSSGSSPNLFMAINFPVSSSLAAGVHPLTNSRRPTNPFDLPNDSVMETLWDMGSLQAALPNTRMPSSDHWWFPGSLVPSYPPAGVPFYTSNAAPLGFVAGQAPSTQMPNVQHAQASAGANPFAQL